MEDKPKPQPDATEEGDEEFAKLFDGDPQDFDVVQIVSDAFAEDLKEILGDSYVPRWSEREGSDESQKQEAD